MKTLDRITYKVNLKFVVEFSKGRDLENLGKSETYFKFYEWKKNYWKSNKNKKGYKVNNNIINRSIWILRSVLMFGNEMKGYNIKVDKWRDLYEYNKPVILDKDEYRRVLEYYEVRNPFYRDIFRFINHTGLRFPSEVFGLRIRNLHLKDGYFVVENRKSRGNRLNSDIPFIDVNIEF